MLRRKYTKSDSALFSPEGGCIIIENGDETKDFFAECYSTSRLSRYVKSKKQKVSALHDNGNKMGFPLVGASKVKPN